jgi:hypothetical protein
LMLDVFNDARSAFLRSVRAPPLKSMFGHTLPKGINQSVGAQQKSKRSTVLVVMSNRVDLSGR